MAPQFEEAQMPNRHEHRVIALLGQAPFELCRGHRLTSADRLADSIGAFMGAVFGADLPDRLEPADSPHHRQAAHGIIPAIGAVILAGSMYRGFVQDLYDQAEATPADSDTHEALRLLRFMAAGFVRAAPNGYLSHLVADSTTPRGLPLFGRLP